MARVLHVFERLTSFLGRDLASPLDEQLCTTNKLVETVDDFVAVQSLLLQQGSTSLNTSRVSH
jgi:hypothetical protein